MAGCGQGAGCGGEFVVVVDDEEGGVQEVCGEFAFAGLVGAQGGEVSARAGVRQVEQGRAGRGGQQDDSGLRRHRLRGGHDMAVVAGGEGRCALGVRVVDEERAARAQRAQAPHHEVGLGTRADHPDRRA
ncbi:hypothetical protein MTP02_08420 [Streptomyces albus]|nr:hypothetical protein MTP02_08420 [Streptomyces albus]